MHTESLPGKLVTSIEGEEERPLRRAARRLFQLPILYKILFANSIIIVIGAVGGVWLTKLLSEESNAALIAFFAVCGISLTIIFNFAVVKTALRPLAELQAIVEQVNQGNTQIRAPIETIDDPDVTHLGQALNLMLDWLDAHTRTIDAQYQQLRQLSAKIMSAQEDERKRIARELHDEAGQALATLLINLEMAEQNVPGSMTEVRSQLAEIRTLSTQTLEGIHKLVYDLRPTLLDDLGLVPALRWYAKNHLEPAGVEVQLEVTGAGRRLSPQVETALFRISQEAMNNVVRHAGAHHAYVSLQVDAELAVLTVEDDGRGFNTQEILFATDKERRLGLFGIEERVSLLGGTFEINSEPGKGTRLRVEVPFRKTGGT